MKNLNEIERERMLEVVNQSEDLLVDGKKVTLKYELKDNFKRVLKKNKIEYTYDSSSKKWTVSEELSEDVIIQVYLDYIFNHKKVKNNSFEIVKVIKESEFKSPLLKRGFDLNVEAKKEFDSISNVNFLDKFEKCSSSYLFCEII